MRAGVRETGRRLETACQGQDTGQLSGCQLLKEKSAGYLPRQLLRLKVRSSGNF
jgi:hypothetical protein